ncbi:MAG: cardiolipin synthase [Pirellulaceae bacterium]
MSESSATVRHAWDLPAWYPACPMDLTRVLLIAVIWVSQPAIAGGAPIHQNRPNVVLTGKGFLVAAQTTPESSDATGRGSWITAPFRFVFKYKWRFIIPFMIVMHILGFLTSIRAIMETRTSQGAIAWGISLNTLPYFAVPAYWVLGQSKFSDYEIERLKDILTDSERGRETARILEEQGMLVAPQSDYERQQASMLEQLAKLPITRFNHAELLIDGQETFDAIFAGIASATDYILVQFYIMRDDVLGQRLKAALIDKAREGVRVYVLFDELGSKQLSPEYIEELRGEGVLIYPFNTTQGGNRFRLNFRNHRKIVVVDGRIAYVGGSNVGDEYLGKHPTLTPWRDTHVAVQGPVVQFVQVSFAEDWLWAVGSNPDWRQEAQHELNWDPEKAPDGDMMALCLPTGPADELETCTLFMLLAISSARERLWIVSPYFVPDEQLMSALQLAALRGVDVRILIPENPDQKLVYYSSFSYLEDAEKAGVKIYRYLDGFLHQKVMLVDSRFSTIGTANFDNRSMRLNFEVTMLIGDEEFASEVEAMLEEDFSNSRLVSAKEYTEASFGFRFLVRVARLMAPVQ